MKVGRTSQAESRRSAQAGVTLAELLVVLALVGVMATIVVGGLERTSPPLDRAVDLSRAMLQRAQSLALAHTKAYRVSTPDANTMLLQWSDRCSGATWTTAEYGVQELPNDVTWTGTSSQVCFNSRGSVDGAATFELAERRDDGSDKIQQLQVLLGGSVRLVP